jgi:hypothetical protein
MENGIFDGKTGKRFQLTCREALKDRDDVQAALAANHHNSCLSCLCREKEGIFLPLTPMLPDGASKLTLCRDEIEEHPSWCFLGFDSDETESERCRSSSILAPVRSRSVLEQGNPDSISLGSRRQYETFARYARKVFSGGLAAAYIATNIGRLKHINPRTLEVFLATDQTIRSLVFTDAPDGYSGARTRGMTLRFGLVFDRVDTDGSPNSCFNCYWWRDGIFSLGLVNAPFEAMAPAIAALKVMSHVLAPPYFVLAVQDAGRCCQRLFFHQVAVAEDFIVPTDSGAEAQTVVTTVRKGGAVIKPVLLEDMEKILAAFGFKLADEEKWRYRPDFLLFWRTSSALTLHIREQRGFEVGSIELYDLLIAAKKVYYDSLKANLATKYEEIDGTKLEWSSPTDGTESWLNTGLPEAPSVFLFL